MARIPLSKGRFAIVDDADAAWLNQWSWYYTNGGYAARTTPRPNRKAILMHRAITNAPDDAEVDHIDGDGMNNQRRNLRVVTHAQNLQNQRCTTGSSVYRGVYWSKRRSRWIAKIQVAGCSLWLGTFETENEAAIAYNIAAKTYFGDYARLNQIERGSRTPGDD